VIFRRTRRDDPEAAEDVESVETGGTGDVEDAPETSRRDGPWDVSEIDLDEDSGRVDLGALLIRGTPGIELRLQVDEATQAVGAVILVGPEGAVELRPFAAPRNADIWEDIRTEIAAETARRGGTATPRDGAYGTELSVSMSARTPEGKPATQVSRVLGIRGPRWLLRASFLGKPALEPDADGVLETALRDVVVVRGSEPMPPGDPLPLVMPTNAQPIQPPSPPGGPQPGDTSTA